MLYKKGKAISAAFGIVSSSILACADQSMEINDQQVLTYIPGESIKEGQLPSGYNASASFQCVSGWDVFFVGDYIYWAWGQDSLELATLVPDDAFMDNIGSKTLYQNPGYSSGFQVGAGFNMPDMDDWNLSARYVWYKNSNTTSANSTNRSLLEFGNIVNGQSMVLDGTISQTIKLHFNDLDLLLKRPFYFGRKLIANFGVGLKALWITEHFDSTIGGFIGSSVENLSVFTKKSIINQKQTSWGLGPKFGFETNWMLGLGLQILADLSASVLYTQYNLSATNSGLHDDGFRIATIDTAIEALDNYGTLRPITEAFLGLGWNGGLYRDRLRIAFSVGYDFNVYWSYNMNNYPVNKVLGNLYLQGLNVQARFDF